jgi:hypothetical protein
MIKLFGLLCVFSLQVIANADVAFQRSWIKTNLIQPFFTPDHLNPELRSNALPSLVEAVEKTVASGKPKYIQKNIWRVKPQSKLAQNLKLIMQEPSVGTLLRFAATQPGLAGIQQQNSQKFFVSVFQSLAVTDDPNLKAAKRFSMDLASFQKLVTKLDKELKQGSTMSDLAVRLIRDFTLEQTTTWKNMIPHGELWTWAEIGKDVHALVKKHPNSLKLDIEPFKLALKPVSLQNMVQGSLATPSSANQFEAKLSQLMKSNAPQDRKTLGALMRNPNDIVSLLETFQHHQSTSLTLEEFRKVMDYGIELSKQNYAVQHAMETFLTKNEFWINTKLQIQDARYQFWIKYMKDVASSSPVGLMSENQKFMLETMSRANTFAKDSRVFRPHLTPEIQAQMTQVVQEIQKPHVAGNLGSFTGQTSPFANFRGSADSFGSSVGNDISHAQVGRAPRASMHGDVPHSSRGGFGNWLRKAF